MKVMRQATTLMVGGTLAWIGAVGAQQAQPQQAQPQQAQPQGQQGQQGQQGLPETQHQREALGEGGSGLFERLDANHDGSISRAEAQSESGLTERWSEYDKNSDQALDQEELSAYDQSTSSAPEGEDIAVAEGGETIEGLPASPHQQEAVRNQLVDLLDEDGDGAISQGEAASETDLLSQWDQLDRNDDGKLDSNELGRVEQQRPEQ